MKKSAIALITVLSLSSAVAASPILTRSTRLDVPERHITGYEAGPVQLRLYRNAFSVVFPGNVWGKGWVRTARAGSVTLTATPEPLDNLIMVAVAW